MVAGIKILKEAKDSILGEAPSDEIVKQITDVVESTEGALGIHDLTVHNYGPGHVIAALHVEVDGHANVFETHDMVDNIEKRLRTECGIEATIHMDPIVVDDAENDAMKSFVIEKVKSVDERLNIHDFRFVKGKTHTNLLFDISVPFEIKGRDGDIVDAIQQRIAEEKPDHFIVVNVDRC